MTSPTFNNPAAPVWKPVPMKPRERVLTALKLEEPDRVPLFELHVPSAISRKVLNQETVLMGDAEPCYRLISEGTSVELINDTIASELVRCCRSLGLDFIRVSGSFLPSTQVTRADGHWIVNGGRYKYSFGSMWRLDEPESYDPDEVLNGSRGAELHEIPPETFSVLRRVRQVVRDEFFLSFDADGSWGPIVSNPNLLKHVLLWMRRRPDVVEALINRHTTSAIQLGEAAIDNGADAIMMCVDYGLGAGPWMSPEMFRRFVKPALARQCAAFWSKGVYPILHSDGNIMPLLPDIVDAGVMAYQGIDVIAGMDLRAVKEEFGDRLCLIGNVDPRVIEFGSRSDVEGEVRRCLESAAEGGGFILSVSANVSANLNADNFFHMLEYARRVGRYPIGM